MSELITTIGWLAALGATAYFLTRNRPPTLHEALAAPPKAASDLGSANTIAELMRELDAPRSRPALVRRMIRMIEQHSENEEVALYCIAVEPDGMVEHHASCDFSDTRLAIDALLDVHDQFAPRRRAATNAARKCLGLKVRNA